MPKPQWLTQKEYRERLDLGRVNGWRYRRPDGSFYYGQPGFGYAYGRIGLLSASAIGSTGAEVIYLQPSKKLDAVEVLTQKFIEILRSA